MSEPKKTRAKKAKKPRAPIATLSATPQPTVPTPPRNVYFILDPSACTLGIGNLQRWLDRDFVQSQLSENVHLHLYVLQYTLRELDFQRRGPMVGSTAAHEAIKFIDGLYEREASGLSGVSARVMYEGPAEDRTVEDRTEDETAENAGQGKASAEGSLESGIGHPVNGNGAGDARQNTCAIPFSIYIEDAPPQFPSWEKCLKYRMWHPRQSDLPHVQPVEEQADQSAEMPARLRNLIRLCAYMCKMPPRAQPAEPGAHWKLVSEDQGTKVWATSFGIDCLNVNEAELLLFHAEDETLFAPVNPGADFFLPEDVFDRPPPSDLHRRVDTTAYPYESIWRKEDANRGKKRGDHCKPPFTVVNGVCYEEFDQINYAPRVALVPLVESTLVGEADAVRAGNVSEFDFEALIGALRGTI